MAIDNNSETTPRDIKPKDRTIMGVGVPDDEDNNMWPAWLKPLLQETFFGQCKSHADSHKSECNMYCLDCMNGPLCSLCLTHHTHHRSIQIRRSSYHDVLRMNEIQKLLDISGVQTYIINGAKVVFLNERPQSRPSKGATNTCHVCQRTLLDSSSFCSLGCKIVGTSKNFQKKLLPPQSPTTVVAAVPVSDSEESYISNPSTPPLPIVNYRNAKRRKGIPQRAPLR